LKTLWHNGTFFTMKSENDTVEALLTENGKIINIGPYDLLKNEADKEFNLNGTYLYPGFTDSHMHLIPHGEKLLRLDLSNATSADELMSMLENAYPDLPESEWFIGEGWDENNFPDKRILTKHDLDHITNSPMILTRTCRHAAIVNSKALELAGITKETPDPDDGVIERDEHGEPTGYVKEGSMHRILELIPDSTEEWLTKALQVAIEDLHSLGLTGAVTDDLGYNENYEAPLNAYKNIIGKSKNFRAHLMFRSNVFTNIMEDNVSYEEPWITPGEMKFFIDGSLGGRTALLSNPYLDDPNNYGTTVVSDEEIDELVATARKYNQAVAIHMIGDKAVEKGLDAIERHPVPKGKRDRLIHVNILRDDLVKRMKKLPVVLDIQPTFVVSDFPWVLDCITEDRLDWTYAWKRLINEGFICGGGSDAPIEDPNPILGIYAALFRKKPTDNHDGYLPKEKLSRFEAVHLFTSSNASSIGKGNERGKLDVGYDADFTVLDKNLFQVSEKDMLNTKVVKTVIAGKVVYENNNY